MFIRAQTAFAFVLLALAGAPACKARRTSRGDPECVAFVERILRCDPTAPRSLLDAPERHCPASRRACAQIDTTTGAGCARFVGCLYDGP